MLACKNEQPKIDNVIVKEEIIKKLCLIKSVYQKDKILAAIDFIDLEKKSNLNSHKADKLIVELPDGQCYFNNELKIENLEFSDSVKIIMQKFSFDKEGNFNFGQSVTLTELLNEIKKNKHARFLSSPFEIEILNNQILFLKEIYIP